MNEVYRSDYGNKINEGSSNANYDDDGFFSDVPISGSLSKSLLALNKYVKKNLLYDDSEEANDDSAYFSKETSPNESTLKSDSDSGKSIESPDKYIVSTPLTDADVVLNIIKVQTITERPIATEIKHTEQLTDDYKFQKLYENSTNNLTVQEKQIDEPSQQVTVPTEEIQEVTQQENHSTSLDDLNTITRTKEYTVITGEVKLRNKLITENADTKRHTIHDVSEWVNRANIYPDVYAPLPYKSPSRRYVEGDVNIHYRCPVRREPLPLVPERELARHQAEHMKRLYRDQKRHKYLQEKDIHLFDIEAFDASIKELQDMQNRRHQDNFMPSQKTVVPLNRYDEAEKLVARALYAFNGQTPRELTFKKGDLINVRRQIDSNWYEGEVHGRIGLFPYNYVEILKGDTHTHSPKKPVAVEGQARAKFDFTAQTNLELPLKKGEVVVLTRRIDQNWWEGRNGAKTGIFPDSYVTVLQEPSQAEPPSPGQSASNVEKPAASPAAHGLVNGAARRSLQQHSYTPQHNSPALANAPPATAPLPGYLAKPAHATLAPSERGYGAAPTVDLNNAEPLYVDTNAEAVPYRAMYKYRPQNPDELELQEGDTVYVLEKCDDGWYVGSSQRTGRFGTFPGNYVERI